ncbi:MAG: hypothetical protein LLG13_11320 [Bacteroidales bacterium]|nr:hypothetical protein [Bacteroidales bacterium]
MGKRVTVIFLVFLVLGLAVMGYFLQQGRKNLLTDPYKAISPGACIVIETVDLRSFLNSLTTGKGLFGETGKIKEFDEFYRKLKYLDDQLNKPAFKELLSNGSSVISFHPSKEGKLEPLLSMAVSGETNRHLKGVLQSSGIKYVTGSKTGKNSILKIPFIVNSRKDTAYISIMSGLIVCSSSEDLIKKAFIQIGKEVDIRNLTGFSKVFQASGKNEDKIFLVFSNLNEFSKTFFRSDARSIADKIVKMAGTSEGDIFINENGLVLSGYTECTDTTEILYNYQFLPPHEFHTYKILPSSTVLFETQGIPKGSLTNKQDTSAYHEINKLAARLSEYAGEEITRAYLNMKEKSANDNALIIYELTNRPQAEQIFLEELGAEKEVSYYEDDANTRIPVYKTRFKGFAEVMVPGFAPGFDDSYFSFYDNFMITGSSYATISELFYNNILNKTLTNDVTYRDFESTLPSRAGYFFYCVPSKIIDYLGGFLNDDIVKCLKLNNNSIYKIKAIGCQLASSNNMIYNSLSIKFSESARSESTIEWTTLLDTCSGTKPFFFANHYTGAKEIFIQDLKNNAYLINDAGRVIWKVPLMEKITGNIYMIDYFRNGKYQLLFSGRNYLHLLDRNGNYVGKYPVKLKSPATNPLVLVDYDNNLNYRLYVAGDDKKIYSYDKTGSAVKGWKPFRTSGLVKSEINYFKVSGKDYLVASDETSVYFLDRTGNKRIDLKEPVARANGSAMRLNAGSDPYVVCSSPDGTVQQIYFDGSVKKISLRKLPDDHMFDFFDIDGDSFGEYIFIEKGILYLYDNDKAEIFTKRFNSENLSGLVNFIFSSPDRKIGLFDANENMIYMIDETGEIMNGFPLKGASVFSIGKLSDKSGWRLITGSSDKFLYSYKIDIDIK